MARAGEVPIRTATRGRRLAELAAAVASAGVHAVTTCAPRWQVLDQILVGGGWLAYLAARGRVPGEFDAFGLRRWGLTASLAPTACTGALGVVACAIVGLTRGSLAIDPNFVPLLLLYPLWGLVQQLVVLGIVAGNLEALGVRHGVLVPIVAGAFALVHVPDWPLTTATLLLGAACGLLFLRFRNLWPLAVLHGWLGVVFYRWVLERDPWADLVTGGS